MFYKANKTQLLIVSTDRYKKSLASNQPFVIQNCLFLYYTTERQSRVVDNLPSFKSIKQFKKPDIVRLFKLSIEYLVFYFLFFSINQRAVFSMPWSKTYSGCHLSNFLILEKSRQLLYISPKRASL